MGRGLFITIEGIEGSGKSTLSRGLRSALGEERVVLTREPGGTDIGAKIRSILLSPENSALTSTAELLLFAADRAQHVEEKIKPALACGTTVICDRFIHSTLAYQGYGRGLDLELLKKLNATATVGLSPDLVILLDLDPVAGMSRVRARASTEGTDRIEQQAIDFHQRIRNGFLELAKNQTELFLVLDATRPPAELVATAQTRISGLVSTEKNR